MVSSARAPGCACSLASALRAAASRSASAVASGSAGACGEDVPTSTPTVACGGLGAEVPTGAGGGVRSRPLVVDEGSLPLDADEPRGAGVGVGAGLLVGVGVVVGVGVACRSLRSSAFAGVLR